MRPVQVLFICKENAGRSQMGEAFCNALGRGRVRATSAGTRPAASVDAHVVRAMRELGYDLRGRQPKRLIPVAVQSADVVVVMSCEDEPGRFGPSVKTKRWDMPDPRGKAIEEVRSIRDTVLRCVSELLAEIAPTSNVRSRPNIADVVKATWLLILTSVGIAIAGLVAGNRGLAFVGLAGMVALAIANGANDLPKSIATLVGSGVTSYRRALWVGTLAMSVGGGLAILWSGALLRLFSPGGITTVDGNTFPLFPVTVIGASAGWVLLATSLGLPVSTTHALVGASVGAALAAQGIGAVRWGTLALVAVVPLLAAPLIAVILGFAISRAAPHRQDDERRLMPRILHLLSAAGSSAARALNDVPKIAGIGLMALAIGTPAVDSNQSPLLIGVTVVAMAVGGLWAGWRVNQTLAFRLTTLDARSGLAANASNTVLVGAGSFLGLPLSTTHVSGAALVGATMGGRGAKIRWNVLRDIVTAWVVTVPGSALLATILWWLLRSMSSWY